MTAPNIEMIASSLRNCSLNGGRRRGRRHAAAAWDGAAEGSDDSEGVTVELNSEVALPYHWEQCLDIRTGQVYYINWEDGTRTTVDPRTSSAFSSSSTARSTSSGSRRSRARRASSTSSSGYTSVSSVGAAAWRASSNDGGGYSYGYGYGYDDGDGDGDDEESRSSASSSRSSAISSTLSSFSPTDESASGGNGAGMGGGNAGHVLVAAGCRACFMYFMVPKRAEVCPQCGSSGLLHLSRNGYV